MNDDLLHQLGKNLGANPDELRSALESGQINSLLSQLRPADSKRMQEILSNPEQAKQLLNSPQAQAFLKRFQK